MQRVSVYSRSIKPLAPVGQSVCHLVNMWVPVFIMSGLGAGAVDAGEESWLGEVQFTGVQSKRFTNHPLNAPTHSPDLE